MSEIIRELMVATGLTETQIRRIVHNAPDRYKTYKIPKRNGTLRTISQPAKEVKLLQRALSDVLLSGLSVHPSAMAYRKGLSIRDNAKVHKDNGPIIKMDLLDFFPSIKKSDWVKYCNETKCLNNYEDIEITSNLLFHRPRGSRVLRLAIGAPSSPILSNALMFKFDCEVTQALASGRVVYTRYADDLTFSAPRTGYLHGVIQLVVKIARRLEYPHIQINNGKTVYVTKKYRRVVTGLTLSNEGDITIGRHRKRQIHAAVHRAAIQEISDDEMQRLCGILAYVNAVEPDFIDTLRRKYGGNIISKIQSSVVRS